MENSIYFLFNIEIEPHCTKDTKYFARYKYSDYNIDYTAGRSNYNIHKLFDRS